MSSEDSRVPDLHLERYRLGELPPDEAARVEARLAQDEPLRLRLLALEASDAQIRSAYPDDWLAERVRARLAARAPRRRGPRAVPYWTAALATAAAVLIVFSPRLRSLVGLSAVWGPGARPVPAEGRPAAAAPTPTPAGDRLKGLPPSLVLFRRTEGGSEPLADGARVRAGDVVRIGYQAAGRAYGVIVSVDGAGVVTSHLPASGAQAVALRGGGTVWLGYGYELDDAPRWERFYFVVADRPFALSAVEAAAHRIASDAARTAPPLPLPPSLEQSAFSLVKEELP